MFEGDSADICAGKFLMMKMKSWWLCVLLGFLCCNFLDDFFAIHQCNKWFFHHKGLIPFPVSMSQVNVTQSSMNLVCETWYETFCVNCSMNSYVIFHIASLISFPLTLALARAYFYLRLHAGYNKSVWFLNKIWITFSHFWHNFGLILSFIFGNMTNMAVGFNISCWTLTMKLTRLSVPSVSKNYQYAREVPLLRSQPSRNKVCESCLYE